RKGGGGGGAGGARRRPARKAPRPGTDAGGFGDGVDRHETDIVSVAGVARTRIAEPDEEQHGKKPVGSCPGRSAARSEGSGALLDRDRHELRIWEGPGSAVHRSASERCALHRIRDTTRSCPYFFSAARGFFSAAAWA